MGIRLRYMCEEVGNPCSSTTAGASAGPASRKNRLTPSIMAVRGWVGVGARCMGGGLSRAETEPASGIVPLLLAGPAEDLFRPRARKFYAFAHGVRTPTVGNSSFLEAE